MKPGEPLANNYNIPHLAGEAVREREAKRILGILDDLFESNHTEPVAVNIELERLYFEIEQLVNSDLFRPESTTITKPYEQFDHSGVTLVSRIIRMHSAPTSTAFDSSNIYLLGLMGEDQTTVTP